jgi:hypothetical protein
MQGCALEIVELVQVNSLSEVYERQDHILLCSKVQEIQPCISFDSDIGLVFLNQIADDVEMAAVGRIEERGETLIIALVHPNLHLLDVLLLPAYTRSTVSAHTQCNFAEEDLHERKMSLIGKLVQHVITLRIYKGEDVDIGIVLQVFF